ncbi:hypothetical protein EDB92DRAFT_1812871 [Lactarius akahatsu]|uniref:Uncharacterized protein n=1 Tax=Lactarius akahatsu TaxID=416441 RepID=A0AAD4LRM8_9AGAM|nr:hypothetical protein EDB92DRAFT_1812871 [Lactarius akahatsu]
MSDALTISQASHAVDGIKDNVSQAMVGLVSEHMRPSRRSQDFEEKEIGLMSRGQKRTEAQKCGHGIKIQNNEQRWPVLGIIRSDECDLDYESRDHPENKRVNSIKSAASSPGEIIRECQNRQRNMQNTPAIGWQFITPALTHFPLAAGLDAPPSAKAQENGGLMVESQRRRRGAQSRNQESSLWPRNLCCWEEWRGRPLLVVWGRGRANNEVVSVTEAQEREQRKHPPKRPDGRGEERERATTAPTAAIRLRVEIAREGSRSAETSWRRENKRWYSSSGNHWSISSAGRVVWWVTGE